jgi:glycerol-3-phosphate acyltransferase PlsY
MDWIAVLIGYGLGSVPFSYMLAVRLGGVDLRRSGSGNVGATNVLRTVGPTAAILAVALDAFKGAAAVVVARALERPEPIVSGAAIAAVVGHVYPVWLRFRGGKGVATGSGAFAVLAPAATALAGLVFALTVWWTRYASLGSIIAALSFAPFVYATGGSAGVLVSAGAVGSLVLVRHRDNWRRLRAGVEPRVGQRV